MTEEDGVSRPFYAVRFLPESYKPRDSYRDEDGREIRIHSGPYGSSPGARERAHEVRRSLESVGEILDS